MVALTQEPDSHYETITLQDWIDLTGAERMGRNIVRTREDCVLIEPPDSISHPWLRVSNEGIEALQPRSVPKHTIEWLAGMDLKNTYNALEAFDAFIKGHRGYSRWFAENDFVEVNVPQLPLVYRRAKIEVPRIWL